METQKKGRLTNIAIVAFLLLSIIGAVIAYLNECDEGVCPSIAEFIQGFGPLAPLVLGVLYLISSPIPFLAPLLSAAAGALFSTLFMGTLWGTVLGTGYTMLVAAISALIPFMLARRLGREWVESKLEGKRLEQIYRESEQQGFWFVVALRAIPLLPWEIQNYVAGLTKVSIITYFVATMVGIIPGTFSLVFLGASATNPKPLQLTIAVIIKIITALVPVVAIAIRTRRNRKKDKEAAQ